MIPPRNRRAAFSGPSSPGCAVASSILGRGVPYATRLWDYRNEGLCSSDTANQLAEIEDEASNKLS